MHNSDIAGVVHNIHMMYDPKKKYNDPQMCYNYA